MEMKEEPTVRIFNNMEKLTGNKGYAIPYANEIHLDSKYANTEFGEAILKHERKHIEKLTKILEGKNRYITMIENNLWDFFDVMKISFKHERKNFIKQIVISFVIFFLFAFAIQHIVPAFCDSAPPGYYKVDIQGAKVVSEGGYFHFYIKNIGTDNITVTFLNYTGSDVFLEPGDSITYKIIAPEINSPYQNVTYAFKIYAYTSNSTEIRSYSVAIVKSDLVQKYAEMERQLRLYVPLLMITTGILLFIGTSYIVEQIWKFIQIVKARRKRK